MKYFLVIIFLLIILLSTTQAEVSNDTLMNRAVYDTSKFEVRNPAEITLSKYRNDKDFIYDRAEAPLSFWDKIKIWVNSYLKEFISSEGFSIYFTYFLYSIAAVSVFLVIYVLLKSNLRGLFYGKQGESLNKFKIIEEDINKIDFEKRILDAVSNKDYRLAVRLYYLKILKLLSDKKIIDWQINKTNSAYVKEIKKIDLHNHFEKITSIFEWIWYGEFPIDESNFARVKEMFVNFNSNVDKNK